MANGARYFEQRERELLAAGRDPDDDDEWCRPDYEDADAEREP